VLKAKDIFSESFQIGARRLTVSTSGIIPGINELAQRKMQSTLAVSLHAPNHEIRRSIMGIEEKYNMTDLKSALKNYTTQTGRRVTIEYLLIKGVNDSTDAAVELAHYIRDIKCNVNLIPYNPVDECYERPSGNSVMRFKSILEQSGKKVTVRLERGVDIDAACGQLRGKY
jgi:23S rRNA (adenine2503-C2)-methyltransferase